MCYKTDPSAMAPRNQARNSKPDSVAANTEDAQLLTSLFTKWIVEPEDKARKWHQHPTCTMKFSKIAMKKLRKMFVQFYAENYGGGTEFKLLCHFYPKLTLIYFTFSTKRSDTIPIKNYPVPCIRQ